MRSGLISNRYVHRVNIERETEILKTVELYLFARIYFLRYGERE